MSIRVAVGSVAPPDFLPPPWRVSLEEAPSSYQYCDFFVYIWCLDCVCENEARGLCHAEGRCAGPITLFAMPVEESFQGTMVDILPECCLSAVPRGREFPVLFFLFFRPKYPLQPCCSVGAGDTMEPCGSKLPRSDPHSALAKSPPPERSSGPAVLGFVFGPFFHPF